MEQGNNIRQSSDIEQGDDLRRVDVEQGRDRLRIGDAEREATAALLGEHHAVGRLDAAELDERLTAVWSARTRADLAATTYDLPTLSAPAVPRPAPTPAVRSRLPARDPGFRPHLLSYVVVILGLWLVWALTGFGHPWPVWPMLGWGLGLLGHRANPCGAVTASGGGSR